ncbi:MAG TPA: hypothetical protein VM182_10990 [Terriglobia bacterium]|nr:hypothetical protein [Terriglobia bacterium]
MQQFGLGFRIFAYHLTFLGQVNFHVQIFQGDKVPEVTVQTVSLFNDHRSAAWVSIQESEHFAKLFSSGRFGPFNINEFFHDREAMFQGIFPKEL